MALQREIRPGAMPFWMLNDSATVAERLVFLRRCHAGGIEALTLHCRSGNLIPYASREWYAMVQAIVEEAARLDMQIWLYDEDPYPSGAAGGMVMAERPELYARAMHPLQPSPELAEGDLWFIGPDRILWAGLVPDDPAGTVHDLTAEVGSLRADWFMTDWDSRYYYEETPLWPCPRGDARRQRYAMRMPAIPAGYQLLALSVAQVGEEGSWGGLPDLLNPDTFHDFCRLSLDPYTECVGEHFGTTIPGIFTDEPKYFGTWPVTRGLFAAFRERWGYDLRPCLYRLFGERDDEESRKVRIDYRQWLTERFRECFVIPYRTWAHAHDLHVVGHLSPEDDPIAESQTLGSLMQILVDLGIPGTDVIVPGTGTDDAPTLNLGSLRAASIRAQQQAPMCISESLALAGWDITSRKALQLLAWQSVLGIDRFFFHGFFSSNDGVTIYEAPPDYGPSSPIFRGMCEVNGWLKRIEQLTDDCEEDVQVGVLNSLTPFYTLSDTITPDLRHMRTSLWQSLLAALQAHVAVHLVDEAQLAEEEIADGHLRVGACSYRYILVPAYTVLPAQALSVLQQAAAQGVQVIWFGKGPKHYLDAANRQQAVEGLKGQVLKEPFPDAAWCAKSLPVQLSVDGEGADRVYVRRFRKHDAEYLLAMNHDDDEYTLTLGGAWQAVEISGQAEPTDEGTRWQVPAQGVGLFAATADSAAQPRRFETLRESGADRTFTPAAPNVLRLQEVEVRRDGHAPQTHPWPRVYSGLYDDWRASKMLTTYAGPMPVESSVPESVVTYCFSFRTEGLQSVPELVLDPRCARGTFDVAIDGRPVASALTFPLAGRTGLRLPLGNLADGEHALTFCFAMRSAMEGLLVQLYVEGDFDLDLEAPLPILRPYSAADSEAGWPAAGLPHYMGDGSYAWQEELSEAEAAGELWLEVDEIVDAGELRVNGEAVGTRAWPPYRWQLSNLQPGANSFDLRVSSTAGNRFALAYPAQAQGWLGKGRFLKAVPDTPGN